MAGNSAGARKGAAGLKAKYGTDAQGRSIYHAAIGSKGGENSPGYFRKLKAESPDKFLEISSKGGKTKREKHADTQASDSGQPGQAQRPR